MSRVRESKFNLIIVISIVFILIVSGSLLYFSYSDEKMTIKDQLRNQVKLRNDYIQQMLDETNSVFIDQLIVLNRIDDITVQKQRIFEDLFDDSLTIKNLEYYEQSSSKPEWVVGLIPGLEINILNLVEIKEDYVMSIAYANWDGNKLRNAVRVDYSAQGFVKHIQKNYLHEESPISFRVKKLNAYYDSNSNESLSINSIEDNDVIMLEDRSLISSKIDVSSMSLEIFIYDDITENFNKLNSNYLLLMLIIFILESVLIHFVNIIVKRLSNPFSVAVNQMERFLKEDDITRIVNTDSTYDYMVYDVYNGLLNEYELLSNEEDLYQNEIYESKKNSVQLDDDLAVVKEKIQEMYKKLSLIYSKNDLLLKSIDDLYMVLDIQGNILSVNDAGETLLGAEKGYLVSRNFKDILYEDMNEAELMKLIFSLVDYEQGSRNIWLKNLSNGKRLIMSMNSIVSHNDDGEIKHIKVLGRSISTEVELHNRMARKRKELNFINTVNSSLISNWNVDELLDNITQSIKALFSSELLCTIRLVENEHLVLHSYLKGKYTHILDEKIEIETSDLAFINHSLEVTVLDRKKYANVVPDLDQIIVIPLVTSDKCIGTLIIGKEEPFISKEINLMNAISNQISIVIERARLYDKLKEEYFKTTQVLAAAIEAKDEYTEGHSVRVSRLAELISIEMKCSPEFIENATIAGILHDVGKIPIDDSILTKKGRLTELEYKEMQKHPSFGKAILKPIGLADEIIDGVYLHHRRYDLKGYPQDVELEKLPQIAEIIGVADAFDAITSSRSYSSAESLDYAIEEINKHKGTQFSPDVVEAMTNIYRESPHKLHEIIE